MARPEESRSEAHEVDLHGLTPEQALRRLAQALHAARMRRASAVRVITGRGLGNREQRPVLRERVEAWLRGPEGRRLGVERFERDRHGGSLRVELVAPRRAP